MWKSSKNFGEKDKIETVNIFLWRFEIEKLKKEKRGGRVDISTLAKNLKELKSEMEFYK